MIGELKSELPRVWPIGIAIIYAGLADKDKAFGWLEKPGNNGIASWLSFSE